MVLFVHLEIITACYSVVKVAFDILPVIIVSLSRTRFGKTNKRDEGANKHPSGRKTRAPAENSNFENNQQLIRRWWWLANSLTHMPHDSLNLALVGSRVRTGASVPPGAEPVDRRPDGLLVFGNDANEADVCFARRHDAPENWSWLNGTCLIFFSPLLFSMMQLVLWWGE